MGSERRKTTLGELALAGSAEIQTGPFGTMLHASSYVDSGTPVVAVKNVGDNRLQHEGLPRIEDAEANRLGRYRLAAGDIVFCRKGSVERRAIIQPCEAGWIQGSDCIRVRFDRSRVSPEYVSLVLGGKVARTWLMQHAHGATMPSLNQEILSRLPLPLPPLAEQEAIARILGVLDDKVELNRNMSRKLDEVATALYRSWFVEPAGRTWLGEGTIVPDGWRVSRLGDEVEATRGLSYSSKNLVEAGAGLPLHNLNTVHEGGGYKHAGLKWFDGQYKERNTVVPGDLVVTNVEQGFEFLLIGFGALVPRSAGEVSVFSADLFRVRPLSTSALTSVYLYQLLREPRFHRVVAGYSNGTTVNHLSPDAFAMPRMVVPPAPLVKRYTEAVSPMLLRMELLHEESLLLRQTRDALLPKLVSGELQLADAKKAVEEDA